jgi:hypothetical protein
MRDVSQHMMRASTSFAEGTFLSLQETLSLASAKPIVPRALHSQSFALFLGVRTRFLYPPLKILEMKEVSMFPRTKRVFSTTTSKERKRGRRFSALRDRKRERENDPRA